MRVVRRSPFALDGISLAKRAFGERPSRELINERRRGYPSANGPNASHSDRQTIEKEADFIGCSSELSSVLDVEAINHLLRDWPENVDSEQIENRYRWDLLRAMSISHFIRRTYGTK